MCPDLGLYEILLSLNVLHPTLTPFRLPGGRSEGYREAPRADAGPVPGWQVASRGGPRRGGAGHPPPGEDHQGLPPGLV